MTNTRFRNSGRKNRIFALFFTILIHTALLTILIYGADSAQSLPDLMPDFIKEWFDSGQELKEASDKNKV